MTPDEHAMLTFARQWLPYGGGDEHILPEFGLLPPVFYSRLHQLLGKNRFLGDDFGVRRQLLEQCAVKLAGAPRSPRRVGVNTRRIA
ncbi:MAG: DUF3263 domain-containing protein [Rhodococcus sp. (in: high G+C Gram-positive bacteria)]